jgi:AAA domain
MSQNPPIPIDRLNVRTPRQLQARAKELGGAEYIIEGLVPKQSISLLVGDSGLGKSPFLYQAAISVAAGVPFLGKAVRPGRVLYMDSENGIAQVWDTISRVSSFLGLSDVPDGLLMWNLNDASGFGQKGNELEDLVREFRPDWVIIDPINSVFNDIEQEATVATQHLQTLRALMANYHLSFTGVHHVRKSSENPKEKPKPLEKADLSDFFNRARGSKVLVNGTDVRLGIDRAERDPSSMVVIRGFERVNGEIPAMLVRRVLGEDGRPVGYALTGGVSLLTNPGHAAAYRHLPERFRFKDAKLAYGKSDSATANFLKACESVGIVRKVGDGYEKVSDEDGPEEQIFIAA